jgi:hypothetical protein
MEHSRRGYETSSIAAVVSTVLLMLILRQTPRGLVFMGKAIDHEEAKRILLEEFSLKKV